MSSCEKNKAPCRYMPYQSYINSSAVWYKKKPVHWKCERFKYNFIEKTKINATHLPAGSISFGEVVYKNEKNLSKDTKNSYQEVLAGEYLINPLNLNFDLISLRTALSDIDVVVSTGYIVLQSRGELYSRFARWLLQQFDVSHMKTLGAGVRQTINYADIGNSIFCQPSLEEQITIAAFLDHETAKIDILIDKQQQLIELLKEKRQAVISHAVTKGLNPDVQMKNSGVEWLGEVPEHWVIQKIKWFATMKSGDFITSESIEIEDEFPVYGGNGLRGYSKRYTHDGKYVLIGRQGALCGNINYANGKFWASEHAVVVSPYGNNEVIWLGVLFGFMNFNQYSFSAAQPGLAVERIKDLHIPIPPSSEQKLISRFLDFEIQLFESIKDKCNQSITLLQERRTALISAAVTGKIDVRDWQVPVTQTESDEVMA